MTPPRGSLCWGVIQPHSGPQERAIATDPVLALVDGVGGWLTADQALRLAAEVRRLPAAPRVLEVGSHQGRSTVALAGARPDVEVVAVDPFEAAGKFGGPATREVFEANLAAAGLRDRVRHLNRRSAEVRAEWRESLDLVFVDGKHDWWSTRSDLRWGALLPLGGRLLVHDGFSSLGVTLALLTDVLPARGWRYVDRVGTLVVLERAAPRPGDRARLLTQLPWWLRNLVVKVLLRLRLRGPARILLGHHDTADPY